MAWEERMTGSPWDFSFHLLAPDRVGTAASRAGVLHTDTTLLVVEMLTHSEHIGQ